MKKQEEIDTTPLSVESREACAYSRLVFQKLKEFKTFPVCVCQTCCALDHSQ